MSEKKPVLKYFYADSQGNTINNPRFYRQGERQLNRLNRKAWGEIPSWAIGENLSSNGDLTNQESPSKAT